MSESHPKLQAAAREAIGGQRRGLMAILPFLGPAFIASIAYIDPGNFATNIQGGAQFGYALLWVILLANLMAMLLQSLSAKLGIATGKKSCGDVPRSLPRVGMLRPLDYTGVHRNGNGPCGVSRGGDRAQSTASHSSVTGGSPSREYSFSLFLQ